jgi:2-polyprenyl-6-methoxyphenol hydroxylase-like FAD-dependent oxidoreductase
MTMWTMLWLTGVHVALVLFKIDDDDALRISTTEEARTFLMQEFPNVFPLIPESEIKLFAQRPPGQLPTFKYAWPELHFSSSIALADDAIHTVKPYFGLGVNGALDDVRFLCQCIAKHQVFIVPLPSQLPSRSRAKYWYTCLAHRQLTPPSLPTCSMCRRTGRPL